MINKAGIRFAFLLLLLIPILYLSVGCRGNRNETTDNTLKKNNATETSQKGESEKAVSAYMEAYNLYAKLKKQPGFSRADAMTQVSNLLKKDPNVTDIRIDASYRVIEFTSGGTRFMIDDTEDMQFGH